jgi:hypothetical protein
LKSKIFWLTGGDRNTSLFHKQSKVRTIRNNVKDISWEDGSKIFEFEELKNVSRLYYCSLFEKVEVALLNIEGLLENIPIQILSAENNEIMKPIEAEI